MSDLDDQDFAIRAPYIHRILELENQVRVLREASIALLDRWDTPLWKDVAPTADFIGRLRKAIAATAPKEEK